MPDPISSVENLHRFGASASRPNANTVVAGTQYWDTDSSVVSQSDGSDWSVILTASGVAASTGWTLVGTGYTSAGVWDQSVDGTVAAAEFADLSGYAEIMVFVDKVTASASGFRQVQVSTDNGSTYLTSSGDYESIDDAGTTTARTGMSLHTTGSALARSGVCIIRNFNKTTQKLCEFPSKTGSYSAVEIPTTTALNALQVVSVSSSGNLTGGQIYVFGRA